MTAPRKVTFDIFFPHHRFHAINRLERSCIHSFSRLASIACNQRRRSQLQPTQHHSAVPAACSPANILCFQHHNPRAASCQRPSRRQSGESSADHRDVHCLGQFTRRNLRCLNRRQPKILVHNIHLCSVTSVLLTLCPRCYVLVFSYACYKQKTRFSAKFLFRLSMSTSFHGSIPGNSLTARHASSIAASV